MERVRINLDGGYDAVIGGGLLDRCGQLLMPLSGPCRIALVTDMNVAPLYSEKAAASLEKAGFSVFPFILPAGEEAKTPAAVIELWTALAEQRFTRGDCLLALGGGAVSDTAGFAAGCYMRGIRSFTMPTTLLAAVDAAVGGKTAIDLPNGKNLVGVFHQPGAVLCDTDILRDLPPSLLAEGMAEVIKTAMIGDSELFRLCAQTGAEITEILRRCITLKAAIVENDPKEQGDRKLLNLGHTPAHAIERLSGYTISHGKAVAMGLALMSRAAAKLGYCPADIADALCAVLAANGLPTAVPYPAERLTEAARADKKSLGDSITVILPREIGRCEAKEVSFARLADIFRAGMEEQP